MSSSKIPASLRLSSARSGAVAGFVSTLGLAVVGVPSAAMAQTPPASPAPEQLSPITVSGDRGIGDYKVDRTSSPKMPQPILDTPKSVVVIPKELIKEQGATNLKDVLRTTPGISLSTAEGGLSFGDRILIRGFEARGDIFVDGMRDPGVTSREAFNVEQIEIVKGPSSVYSGRGTTGGYVNLVTKQPLNRDLYAADFTFGTDLTKRVTADFNKVIGDNIAIRFNGMWHDGEVAGRDDAFTHRWGIAPSITIGLNTPTSLTLSYYHLSTDELPDYGVPFQLGGTKPMKVKRGNFYGLVDRDFRKTSADIATAEFKHQFNDSIAFRSQFRFGRTTNDYVVSAPEGPNPVLGTVNANAKNNNRWNKSFANQTDVTAKFDTGTVRHTVVAGFEVAREYSHNRPYVISPTAVPQNLYNPDPHQPWLGTISKNPQTYTQLRGDSAAIYLSDSIKINPSWEVMGGLRLDHYRARNEANAFLPRANPADPLVPNTANGLKNTSTFLNWQAGVVYHPMPNGSIYIAASSSSNPSGEQFDGGANDGGLAVTNDNLKPERNRSYEIGTKWDILGDKLSLTAALFRIDKTNARVTGPDGTNQALVGKQRVDGFEVGAAGKITPEWSVYGGFALLDSEVVKASPGTPQLKGRRLPNVAEITFSLWSTYRITERLTVGGMAYYSGPRYGGTFGAGNAHVPGYWRFDAMVNYKLTDNVDVRLNVLNLTNKLYYDAIYRSGTPFAYVGPGRTALVTTAFKF